MNAKEELQTLGLTFDPAPPLRDGRRPMAMAFRAGPDGGYVAAAALEVERFLVLPLEQRGPAGGPLRREVAWTNVAHALSLVNQEREIWHVIATRDRPALDGSMLRVGWVVLGRGATALEAASAAEQAFDDVWTLQLTSIDFITLRSVVSAEGLADFLRPASAPFLCSLRRARWAPPMWVTREGSAETRPPSEEPGALLPWSPWDQSWGALVEALACCPSPAAFLVRIRTAVTPPPEALAAAERDVLAVAREHNRLLESLVSESASLSTDERLAAAASRRVAMLRSPCLLADASLATWEPQSPGLVAVAAGSLTAASPPGGGQSSALPKPPLTRVDLVPGELWEPLDAARDPELLVGAHEAWALVRTAEPPTDERSPLPCSRARSLPLRSAADTGVPLGEAEHRGVSREVRLPDETRFLHTYVVGQTGTGKSTLLLNMIADDIRSGHGVTVLDPHGSLVDDVLARIPPEREQDVIVVDPADGDRYVPLNPLVLSSGGRQDYLSLRDRVIDELLDTAAALYDLSLVGGPMFELYFRSFLSALMGARPPRDYRPIIPMLEVVMGSEGLQQKLMARLAEDDPITVSSLKRAQAARGESSLSNMVPYITSKLNRFYAHTAGRRTLCQGDCLDFSDVVESRKILLVELSPIHLGREAAALIARQVVLRLSVAAMERGASPDAVPHFIYVDEFHNVATERFAALLAEARKFRLGIVLAHQYTSQLVRMHDTRVLDAILGNVGTVAAFRVGANDAGLLERALAPRVVAQDLTGLSNYTAFVRSVGRLSNVPFLLRTKLPPGPSNLQTEELRKRSLARYGHRSAAVDGTISSALEAFEKL